MGELAEVSGIVCANGYVQMANVNSAYVHMGTTADGRPYYRNEDQPHIHLFYDSNCGGGTDGAEWRRGWFIGCAAPSTSASENLQNGEGGSCCTSAQLGSSDSGTSRQALQNLYCRVVSCRG